jgi:hypothetical protein
MKFDDWTDSLNPSRDRAGHSQKELAVIDRIMRCKRYPIPETIVHAGRNYDIFIDSLITSGYQSDEICRYADVEPDIRVPLPSAESEEEINFDSESSGEEELVLAKDAAEKAEKADKAKADEEAEAAATLKKVKKKKRTNSLKIPSKDKFSELHAFDYESLLAYPHTHVEGQVPNEVLR